MKLKLSIFIEIDMDKARDLGAKATVEEAMDGLIEIAKHLCEEIASPPDDQYLETYYEVEETV